MKLFSLIAIVVALSLGFAAADAEAAKRLGGGRSSGMQKQMAPPDKAPAAAPAQAPSSAATPAQAAKAPAAAPSRSWMGPLAGLAAGLGLAALASHFGFGEGLASMMMIGLLIFAVLAAVGYFMRRRAGSAPAYAGASASAANSMAAPFQRQAQRFEPAMPVAAGGGTATAAPALVPAPATVPADFDTAGFERAAKVNFIRLQAANDAGNVDDIRQFTTPEMFGEISLAIKERGATSQSTDVLNIEARVLEVVEDETRYVASVRFTGMVREDGASNPESVDEVWHLTKARSGGGWLLAGIQQLS